MKWNEMIIHSARCLWYCAVIIFRFESLRRFFCRVPLFTFKVKKKHYSTIRILHVIFIILICKKSFFLFLFVCLFLNLIVLLLLKCQKCSLAEKVKHDTLLPRISTGNRKLSLRNSIKNATTWRENCPA